MVWGCVLTPGVVHVISSANKLGSNGKRTYWWPCGLAPIAGKVVLLEGRSGFPKWGRVLGPTKGRRGFAGRRQWHLDRDVLQGLWLVSQVLEGGVKVFQEIP